MPLSTFDLFNPPVIECRAPLDILLRCHCPTCLQLDRQFPNQGYQLSIERWIEIGLQA